MMDTFKVGTHFATHPKEIEEKYDDAEIDCYLYLIRAHQQAENRKQQKMFGAAE